MAYNADEEIRRLKQVSAKKPIIKRGLPNTSEGRDGDVALCLNRSGLGLYIKFNRKWYKFASGKQVARGGSAAVDVSMRAASPEDLIVDDLKVNGTITGSHTLGTLLKFKEDITFSTESLAEIITLNGSGASVITGGGVKALGGVTTVAGNASHVIGAQTGYDSYVQLFRAATREWKIGNDETVGGSADTNTFKIETGTGASFSDTSDFELDTSGNATIKNNLACAEITSGAVIWESFPFIANSITASRGFYYRDNNDNEDFRVWDDFDADMVLDYRKIYGHYIVPEDCTLTRMQGLIANSGSTDDVIINVWYCLQTNIATDDGATTFTKAGSDEDVLIGTSLVGVQFNEDYDVDLTAGSIVIPTVKTAGAGSSSFLGSLTLKFITR